jgi:uncharacterized protein (TIGR02001 family)
MNVRKLTIALSLALLATPMAALAQATPTDAATAAPTAEEAPASNWSWNANITSDYVYRGITLNNYQPTLQGGVNYAFGDSGFYAGFWASHTNFGDGPDGPNIETDNYVGWSHDLSEDWNLDFLLTHYLYLGANHGYGNVDFNQLDAKLTFKQMLTFTTSYANDYVNGGYAYHYYSLSGTHEIGGGFSINGGIGHSIYSDGNGSYTDYNIGVSRQFGPVNAALNYYDTNIDNFRASDAVVLSFAFGS